MQLISDTRGVKVPEMQLSTYGKLESGKWTVWLGGSSDSGWVANLVFDIWRHISYSQKLILSK